MGLWVCLLLLAGVIFRPHPGLASGATGAAELLGGWLTKDDKSVVEVYDCGGTYCLRIVWLKEPTESDGSPKVDKNNPDPAKRLDPIIGLTIGSGFVPGETNIFEGGTIYDPDNGKTYSCRMAIEGDTLKVRGFIGVSLFGRTEAWKRKP
jgi:uncharacterized protein (DUF2147 family)